MKIRISSDSTCDLSPELLEKYDITIAPLSVIIDGQSYKDGVDVTPEDIFRAVDQGKKVQTAAVNQFEYEELFRKLLKDADAVIHFCISREMSSCYSDACEAAKKLGSVYVVDSRNLSTGIGLLVLEACEMAAMGKDAQEVFEAVQSRRDKVVSTFTVQDIGYLYRGGRCSGLEALGAKMLRIRPEIEVNNGKMNPGKKYRGSYEHYLKHYIRDVLKETEDIDYKRIFITHSPCEEGMADFAAECVKEYGHFREILDTTAGGTICVHCGPNTLGILFMKK
jgi:DegV family protein with EDD domain